MPKYTTELVPTMPLPHAATATAHTPPLPHAAADTAAEAVCEHGQLARVCEVCELTAERDEARAQRGQLAADLDRARQDGRERLGAMIRADNAAREAEARAEAAEAERDAARAEAAALRGALDPDMLLGIADGAAGMMPYQRQILRSAAAAIRAAALDTPQEADHAAQ